MIWIASVIVAVFLICVCLFKLWIAKNPDDSIAEAKKKFIPAQMKNSEESKTQKNESKK